MNERERRMFQDGQVIGEISSADIKKLIRDNEFYLKSAGIDPKMHEIECNLAMGRLLMYCIGHLGVAIKLLPEFLRIVANAIDVIVQNSFRDKKEGK